MADYIRRERFLGTDKIIVGSKGTDLVLESLGKIYIKYGNSSRLLGDILKEVETNVKSENTVEPPIITIAPPDTIKSIQYPGDNKLIYDTKSKILYITYNNNYTELVNASTSDIYVKKSGDSMTGQLSIELEDNLYDPPFIVDSKVLVKNLNAEFINGETLKEYTKRTRAEEISKKWKFKEGIETNNILSGTITNINGFTPGMYGIGYELNANTNTLTIDNLIVRKKLTSPEDYASKEEPSISRTKGSSGNLWSTNSFIIDFVGTPESDNESTEFVSNDYYTTTFTGDFYAIKLKSSPFKMGLNNIYRCQLTKGEKIRYYDCIVTNIIDSTIIVRCSKIINDVYIKDSTKTKNLLSKNISETEDEENTVSTPKEGDELVLIGNSISGIVGLYMASIDDDSPALNLIENSTTADYQAQNTLNSRIGVLSNINDLELNPSGNGIYTKNLFAKTGNWIVANGEIRYSTVPGIVLQSNGQIDFSNTTNPFGNNISQYLDSYIDSKLQPIKDTINDIKLDIININSAINNIYLNIDNIRQSIQSNADTISQLELRIQALEGSATS